MQLERPRLVEPLPLGPAPLPPDFDLGPFADAVSAAAPREAEPIDDAAPTAVETDAAYAPPSAESSQQVRTAGLADQTCLRSQLPGTALNRPPCFPQTEALVTSLTAARTAFLTALSGIVRSSMVGTMKPSPSTTTSPRLDTGAHDLLNTLIEQLRSLPSSSTGMVELTTWSEPIDELQARLKLIVSPDAALAVSLGTLLHCIERLMVLYAGAPSTRPSRPASSAGVASWTGGSDGVTVSPFDVYEAIEREADALRSNTRDREAATRGALREVEQAEKDLLWARIDLLLVQVKMLSRDGDTVPVPMTSELPQYELPPGYGNVDGDAAEVMMVPDEKRRIVGGRTDEKMARDLEGVTEAVERLYLISPQLANQRADPDRRQARELALVRLGNAIERLSRGRLDDQRANTIPGQRNGKERADDYAARRRQSLDQLLDSIDRATKRTLSNQRASIDPRQRTILLEARRAAKDAMADFSAADRREEMRLQHIVERTGVGRMSSQDAALGSQLANYRLPGTPSPPAHRPSSSPPPKILPSSAGKDRARSNSVSTLPSVKKRFSMGRLRLSREHSTETVPPLPRSPSRVSPPLPAVSSKGGTLGLRRHTVATDALVELRYLAQVQSNIGTLLIRAWVDGGAVDGWALSSLDGDAAMLRHGVTGVLARIPFPTRVTVPTPWPALVHRDDHLELRLRTADAAVLTRSRPDLELTTPCSAAELKRHPPSSFVCSTCEATLVRVPDGCTMPSLPSEHWAELLEAWMCHTDQVLHDDVASRTSNGFWPRDNELAIASAHILCPITTTSGWAVTPGVEVR